MNAIKETYSSPAFGSLNTSKQPDLASVKGENKFSLDGGEHRAALEAVACRNGISNKIVKVQKM